MKRLRITAVTAAAVVTLAGTAMAYPMSDGTPYAEADFTDRVVTYGQIDGMVSRGADAVRVAITDVMSRETGSYMPALYELANPDYDICMVSDTGEDFGVLYTSDDSPAVAEEQGMPLAYYEDLRDYLGLPDSPILTLDDVYEYIGYNYGGLNVDVYVIDDVNTINSCIEAAVSSGFQSRTMITADGSDMTADELLSCVSDIRSAVDQSGSNIPVGVSASSAAALTEEILSMADCISLPQDEVMNLGAEYIQGMHDRGIAVRAEGVEDYQTLSDRGTDIIASPLPYGSDEPYFDPEAAGAEMYYVFFSSGFDMLTLDALYVSAGTCIAPPELPELGGYTFAGWYEDEAFTVPHDFEAPVTKDITLYAKWDSAVTETETVLETAAEPIVEETTAPAYEEDVSESVPQASVTVYFDMQGIGDQVGSQTVNAGDVIAEPVPVQPEGYRFTGWYMEPECINAYDFSVPVAMDMRLYAGWKEASGTSVTVIFDGNGADESTFTSQTFTEGVQDQYFEGTVSREGCSFSGWSFDSSAEEGTYYMNSGITDEWIEEYAQYGTVTLYATWKEQPEEYRLTVTFDGNGADTNTFGPQTYYIGSTQEQSFTGEIARAGYEMLGWHYDPEAEEAKYATHAVVSDTWIGAVIDQAGHELTLYGVWEKTDSITVTFDGNGADTCTFGTQTYTIGTEDMCFTGEITRAGYEMLGWSEDPQASTETYSVNSNVADSWIQDKINAGGDVVLYAVWKTAETQAQTSAAEVTQAQTETSAQAQSSDMCSVVFNMCGHGVQVNPQLIAYGSYISVPDAPTEQGYIFGGWYTDIEFTVPFDFNQPVTGNKALFAKWYAEGETDIQTVDNSSLSSRTMVVQFYLGGHGKSIDPEYIAYGNRAAKPIDPTSTDYVFLGWYSDPECTQAYDFSAPVTQNLVLYAGWSSQYPDVTYTVTFVSDGVVLNSQYVHAGKLVQEITEPIKNGYVFGGWYSDTYNWTAYDFSAPVTSDLTLTAKWTVGKSAASSSQSMDYQQPASYQNSSVQTQETDSGSGMALLIIGLSVLLAGLVTAIIIIARKTR